MCNKYVSFSLWTNLKKGLKGGWLIKFLNNKQYKNEFLNVTYDSHNSHIHQHLQKSPRMKLHLETMLSQDWQQLVAAVSMINDNYDDRNRIFFCFSDSPRIQVQLINKIIYVCNILWEYFHKALKHQQPFSPMELIIIIIIFNSYNITYK